ncbi:MAG TPA: acetylglutamate kinase, partial [Clostridia bacterium]|nr:acetylglutamate kinase [Clostridia bacterium]
MNDYIQKANILIEALPYIQQLHGKTVVIKYGGNAMKDDFVTKTILEDITLLKFVGINPIVVHGGGPEINYYLSKLDIKSSFHNGLRITDAATMEIVQMVLAGKINKEIVSSLNIMGATAIGLSGKDANVIKVVKNPAPDGVDLGFVGKITDVNTSLLDKLIHDVYIPVISPIGIGDDGSSYNINADTVAGEIAARMRAEKLIFLTDIDGIRHNPRDASTLYSVITVSEVKKLIDDGIIDGGMIPKVRGCINAIEKGVARTHILDGT